MKTILILLTCLWASAALAVDNVLLIQLKPGGGFTVWHTEGESNPTDDEVMSLEVTATPEGGPITPTSAGPARAYQTAQGVSIALPEAPSDKTLLVDRDSCGHLRIWHSAGATHLPDEQMTDIYMSALPEGGKRLTVGDYHVKAFITKLGVTASLWPISPGK